MAVQEENRSGHPLLQRTPVRRLVPAPYPFSSACEGGLAANPGEARMADSGSPPRSHGLESPFFLSDSSVSLCFALSSLCRIPGERKRQPACIHAGCREEYRRTTDRAQHSVSPTTPDVHHRGTSRHRFGL